MNLLIQLHFPPEDVEEFWRLSFLPIDDVMSSLDEKQIPKKVQSAAVLLMHLKSVFGF